jgi:hypothetical protein
VDEVKTTRAAFESWRGFSLKGRESEIRFGAILLQSHRDFKIKLKRHKVIGKSQAENRFYRKRNL